MSFLKHNTSNKMMVKFSKHKVFLLSTSLLVIFLAGILLFVGEYSLRLSMKYANYYELNEESWDPSGSKEVLKVPWLWINPKNGKKIIEKKEYSPVFNFGPDGLLSDAQLLEKENDECRVIFVGDSFVQGFGDTENLSVVGRFKKILNDRDDIEKPYRIINAGIGGSDPVFELELISRVLLKYKPSLIILLINFTDIQDLMRRGGLERFTSDGKLKENSPWWAWIYHRSHLLRAFVTEVLRYDENFMPFSESAAREAAATKGVIEAISAIQQLAKQHSFKLLVLMHPLQREVRSGKISSSLLNIKEALLTKGVDVSDLTYLFRKMIPAQSESDYFWEKDGHYNPKGYAVFASAIEAELRKTPRDCTVNFFIGNEN